MDLMRLRSAHAAAAISPYGGQVMSFVPAAGPDVLWQTAPRFLRAALERGKPLRGGIPLCWPWFGKGNAHPGAPAHGFARLRRWTVEAATPDSATLSLTLDGTDDAFPRKAKATLTVTLTDRLNVSLATTNLGGEAMPLQQALHTYLTVGDVNGVTIHGLQGLQRVHVTPGREREPLAAPLTIGGEVEHLFSPVAQTIRVEDPALGRTLCVAMRGGEQAVVWNPGPEKAMQLDMEPDGYKTMLCVEAANIGLGPVKGGITLQPGQTHTLATTLWSEPL